MKQLYNKTMQEYVDELQLISGKLQKYEVLLKQKYTLLTSSTHVVLTCF